MHSLETATLVKHWIQYISINMSASYKPTGFTEMKQLIIINMDRSSNLCHLKPKETET